MLSALLPLLLPFSGSLTLALGLPSRGCKQPLQGSWFSPERSSRLRCDDTPLRPIMVARGLLENPTMRTDRDTSRQYPSPSSTSRLSRTPSSLRTHGGGPLGDPLASLVRLRSELLVRGGTVLVDNCVLHLIGARRDHLPSYLIVDVSCEVIPL